MLSRQKLESSRIDKDFGDEIEGSVFQHSIGQRQLRLFWHISTPNTDAWKGILRDQWETITSSHIHESVNISAHVIGKFEEVSLILNDTQGIISLHHAGGLDKWEFATLQPLLNFCERDPDAIVGYIHNKGSRYVSNDWRHFSTWAWRKFLEHYVITNYKSCIVSLTHSTEYVDVCAPNIIGDTNSTFWYASGNFWWASCNHVNLLPPFILSDRWSAEWWIGKRGKARIKNCWTPWPDGGDMYRYCFNLSLLDTVYDCSPGVLYEPLRPVLSEKSWPLQFRDLKLFNPSWMPQFAWPGH
jgi:hypothetical protein